jgi:putative transposase
MKGFDFHKKVKGRKRHLLVDTEGLVLAVQITTAKVQDHYQIVPLIAEGKVRSLRLVKVWADQGYQGNLQAQQIQRDLGVELELVARPPSGKGFQVLPRRWVVERTFAWLGRYRRLSKDYDYHAQTSATWIFVAMSHLMLRRLARSGGS